MKTIICQEPGKFVIEEREKPVPEAGKVILKVKRIGICGTDLHAFEGTQPFFVYPRILGHELSGEIVDADSGLKEFKNGDAVTFIPYFSCGKCITCRNNKPNCCKNIEVYGVHTDGGMREYVSVPSDHLVMSKELSFDELALVELMAIGAHAVQISEINTGDTVMVIGAGPIGLGIMEMAKINGAFVIAMDISETRLSFCKDKLKIDYIVKAGENSYKEIKNITGGDFPGIVIDASGNLNAIQDGFKYIAFGGKYVLVGLQKGKICFDHPEFHKREAVLKSSRNATKEDFKNVIKAFEEKKLNTTSYITHRIRFDNLINEFENLLNPNSGIIKAIVEL